MGLIKQIYYHYDLWEEYHCGMWKIITGTQKNILKDKVIEFMNNTELFGFYMNKVSDEWKISCEINFTNDSINKIAWIGQAACCLGANCPEHITREAWHYLSNAKQEKANQKASEVISKWFLKNKNKCQNIQLEFQF